MIGYFLALIMTATVGAADKAEFVSKNPYQSLQACIEEGLKTGNWLTQDFIKIEIECRPADGSKRVRVYRGIPASTRN